MVFNPLLANVSMVMAAPATRAIYNVSTWQELKNAVGNAPWRNNTTINITKDLAADSTIEIPNGKFITIQGQGSKTIYRKNGATGFLSMFKVNGGNLTVGPRLTLSGQTITERSKNVLVPSKVKLERVNYNMYSNPNLSGKEYVLRKYDSQRVLSAKNYSEDISLSYNDNFKFNGQAMNRNLLTNAIFKAQIYGYLSVKPLSQDTKYYYKLRNEATGRSLAARNKTKATGPIYDCFMVNDSEVSRFESFKGKSRGTVAFTFARNYDGYYAQYNNEITFAQNDGRIEGWPSANRNLNEYGMHTTRNYRYMRWNTKWGIYTAYGKLSLGSSTVNTPQLYEVKPVYERQTYLDYNSISNTWFNASELGTYNYNQGGGFFIHNNGGTVNVNSATLTNFKTYLTSSGYRGYKDLAPIYLENNATLGLNNSWVSNNNSEVGAIYTQGSIVTTYNDTALKNNNATYGAMYVTNSNVTMNGSTSVTSNSSSNQAIYAYNSTINTNGSTTVNNNNGQNGVVYLEKSTLNMDGTSEFYNNNKNINATYGAIYAGDNSFVNMKYKANINRNAGKYGAIYTKNSTLNMYNNSSIKNNTSTEDTIYLSGSKMTTSDNAMIKNNSGKHGAMYVTNSNVTMNGSTSVTSNSSGGYQAIYAYNSTINTNGSTSLNNNNGQNGVVYLEKSTLNMNNTSEIYNNNNNINATYGAIYAGKNSLVNMNNQSKIHKNKGTYGAMYVDQSEVNLNDSMGIFNNFCGAGAIYISDATNQAKGVTLNGGNISYNTMTKYGAVTTDGKPQEVGGRFTMNGGFIHHNTTKERGGAIRIFSNGVSLNGGEIHDNKSAIMGGAIYVNGDDPYLSRTLRLPNASIYNNFAYKNGTENNKKYLNDFGLYDWSNDDTIDGHMQSGCGGGVWTCPWGTIIFDPTTVKMDDNYAERTNGGTDFHKDNGLGGAILVKNMGSNWLNQHNEPIPEGLQPSEGVLDLKNTNTGERGSGVKIYNNISRRGGGIAANGTLIFGENEPINRNQAILTFTKEWANATPKEDVHLKVYALADDEYRIDFGTYTIKNGENKAKIYLPTYLKNSTGEEPFFDLNIKEGTVINKNDWKLRIEEVDANGNPSNKYNFNLGDITFNSKTDITQNNEITDANGNVSTQEVNFTTYYFSQTGTNEKQDKPSPALVTLTGEKELELPEGVKIDIQNQFIFGLYAVKDGFETLIETVKNGKNNGNGIEFTPLEFTEEGTYQYVVKEIVGSEDNIIYDDTVREFTVTVTKDNNGNLVTDATDGAIKFDKFVNKYKVKPTYEDGTLQTTVKVDEVTGSKDKAATIEIGEDTVTKDVIDTVTYSNLKTGEQYTLTGTLMKIVEGSEPVAVQTSEAVTFTAERNNGTVEVTFKDVALEANTTYVVYEKAISVNEFEYADGKKYHEAKHEDKEDTSQTIVVNKTEPEKPTYEDGTLQTTVKVDEATGSKDKAATIEIGEDTVTKDVIDTVTYSNLKLGEQYTLTGTLMKIVEGSEPVAVQTSEAVTFTAERNNGTVEVTFKDVALEANTTYVVYEKAISVNEFEYADGKKYHEAKHEDKEDTSQTIVVNKTEPEKHDITISKVDIAGKELPGAHIQIKDNNDKVIEDWTSTTTAKVIKLAEGKYTFHEEAAPNGYLKVTDITFEITKDGKVTNVVVQNNDKAEASESTLTVTDKAEPQKPVVPEKHDITISKVDIAGEELPGAHIQIKDNNGTVVEDWTSTATAKVIKLTEGKYTFHEEAAPNGYLKVTDITFDITKDGKVTNVVVADGDQVVAENGKLTVTDKAEPEKPVVPVKHDITISKVDIAGKELPGAHIQIKDNNGTVIEDWTSTATAKVIKLTEGKYTFHEEAAPNGYLKVTDITFDITKDGKVTNVVVADGDQVVAENGKLTVTDKAEPEKPTYKDGTLATTVNVGGQTGSKDKAATIEISEDTVTTNVTDTIDYKDLFVGVEYQVTGKLMDLTTNKQVATATTTFTPQVANGTTSITFEGVTLTAGHKYVAFEYAKTTTDIEFVEGNKPHTAEHADPSDKAQTIVVTKEEPVTPEPEKPTYKDGTLATTVNVGGQTGSKDKAATIEINEDTVTTNVTDTIDYKDLFVGVEYKMTGKLMDLTTNKQVATATTTFTPQVANGTTSITFEGVTLTAGHKYVAFEYAETTTDIEFVDGNKPHTAEHADPSDKAQTIVVTKEEPVTPEPEKPTYKDGTLATTVNVGDVTGSKDKAATIEINEDTVTTNVTDTIDYKGLFAGVEYKVTGKLMDITDINNPVEVATATTTFTPQTANGSTSITFEGVTVMAGHKYVAFEYAESTTNIEFVEGNKPHTAEHVDPSDKAQTIVVNKEVPEKPVTPEKPVVPVTPVTPEQPDNGGGNPNGPNNNGPATGNPEDGGGRPNNGLGLPTTGAAKSYSVFAGLMSLVGGVFILVARMKKYRK